MKNKIVCLFCVVLSVFMILGCENPVEDISKGSNAELSSLETNTGVLSPDFDNSITVYSVSVPNGISQIQVSGVKSDANAGLSLNNGVMQDLKVGSNKITIIVTAQDGTTKKEYQVFVGRKGAETVSANIGALISVPSGRFQRNGVSGNVSAVDGFIMGNYEITRAQFLTIMDGDPSRTQYSDDDGPVIDQRWYHAIAFCNKLSLAESLQPVYTVSGVDFSTLTYSEIPGAADLNWDAASADWAASGYRLPTEMEWMWAAMGAPSDGQNGNTNVTGYLKAFAGSTGSNFIGDYAWYALNCGDGNTASIDYKAHPVGTKMPNELGLYDMSGNVWERCWDWKGTYPDGLLENYRGVALSDVRVHRGAGWDRSGSDCILSNRSSYYPYGGAWSIGFRVVRKIP